MQREHQTVFKNGVKIHFSLFKWEQCCNCKKDFRREKGFKFVVGPVYGGIGKRHFICSKCALTRKKAHEVALKDTHYVLDHLKYASLQPQKTYKKLTALKMFDILNKHLKIPPNCKKIVLTVEVGKDIEYEVTCDNMKRTKETTSTHSI